MLEKLETTTIAISPAASQAVQDIMTEKNLTGYALRVFVSGGGCCGTQFGMALDNNFADNDITIDVMGVKMVVDNVSMDYLRGASIDFVNDPQRGSGFVVNTPHAHAHSYESCACGGSCSCNN